MNLDKKEIIKNYILDKEVSPKERKERFQIAWDIHAYFDEIRKEITLNKVFRPLKKKIENENILPPSFEISYFDFGSIYITKSEWKEHQKDRGIISIAIERWFREGATVGLVKNKDFSLKDESFVRNILSKEGLRTSSKWWLGYLPNLSEILSLPLFDYYNCILDNPNRLINEYFEALNHILEIVKKEEVQNLLDRFVEKRKLQISNGM